MTLRSAPYALSCALLVTFAGAGCRRSSEAVEDLTPPAPNESAKALDRLLPGELRPGEEEAFGLLLPHGMRVIGRFDRTVHAAGNLKPEDVANYVRDRVVVDRVELGAASTLFPNARIKNAPPSKRFLIEVVSAAPARTVLKVRDITPPPPTQGLSEAERWKRAGLRPDGRLAEPETMQ